MLIYECSFSPTLYKNTPSIQLVRCKPGEEEGDPSIPGRVIWRKVRNVDGWLQVQQLEIDESGSTIHHQLPAPQHRRSQRVQWVHLHPTGR